jgi:hypothetical protein
MLCLRRFYKQLSKLSSIQYRSLLEQKKWTGWELNPRLQWQLVPLNDKLQALLKLKEKKERRER